MVAYSGQTAASRAAAAEDDLLNNRVKAVVATSALGMGFDKPDLGFVVHLGAPPSPIAYYQQVGRAGRGVERAAVVLLPGREDREVWNYFASLAFPPEHQVRRTLGVLSAASGPCLDPAAGATGRARPDPAGDDAQGARRGRRGPPGPGRLGRPPGSPGPTTPTATCGSAQTRRAEQQAMVDYVATTGCRMEYLRLALDDPAAAPCGRCDNCAGLALPAAVDAASARTADARLLHPGVTLDPRKQWPSGMSLLGVELSGRIPADEQAGPGRAVSRLTDLGWGAQVRRLFVGPDAELPTPLKHAVVEVLREWQPEPRPEVVVHLDSRRRPVLVGALAAGLAGFLKLPLATRFSLRDEPEPEPDPAGEESEADAETNSAYRLATVVRRFVLDDPDAVRDRSVLLIDDRSLSGWTLAVAARELRRAGAVAVHPLVVASS